MNFMEEEEEEKGHSCNNEEEEEDQTSKLTIPFSSNSTSSSPSSNYKSFLLHHHHQQNKNLRLGSSDSHQDYNNNSNLEFMDLSLGNNTITEEPSGSSTGGGESSSSRPIEKEHMFDKVVTPSDVGKLNRLVIPKQHAEKYFPLDSSSNEKGLLLNFEDRTGKSWRFRYSYWNSSQSYVMTKGWSRFVKEKKLDAGDVVSFQRGVGELGNGRLFIDWRRRPDAPDPTSLAQLQFQNQLHFQQSSVRWGRLYPLSQSLPVPRNYEHLQRLNYSNTYAYPYHHHHHPHQQQQQQQHQVFSYGIDNNNNHNNATVLPQYYLRPISHQIGTSNSVPPPLVIDSVPVVPHLHGNYKTPSKRLRLFGVNMDCPIQDDQSPVVHGQVMSSIPSHHLGSSWVSNTTAAISTREADDHHQRSNKGKSSASLSFDVDL